MLRSRNVTVEVNTVFENLQSLVRAIDPAKLNAVFTAIAEAVRGKGKRMGQAITAANDVLLAVNPRMPTAQRDWQLFGQTAQAYSAAAQDILSTLAAFTTTSTTITTNASSLDALLLSAVGFSQSGINTIGGNQPALVRAMNILDPRPPCSSGTRRPTPACSRAPNGSWRTAAGTHWAANGKSVIMDAALLAGDDPYRYPDNLPITNATGGRAASPAAARCRTPARTSR